MHRIPSAYLQCVGSPPPVLMERLGFPRGCYLDSILLLLLFRSRCACSTRLILIVTHCRRVVACAAAAPGPGLLCNFVWNTRNTHIHTHSPKQERRRKDEAVRATIMQKLIETGERERLKDLLRERLIQCGWRDELKVRVYLRSAQSLSKIMLLFVCCCGLSWVKVVPTNTSLSGRTDVIFLSEAFVDFYEMKLRVKSRPAPGRP